MDDWRCPKEWSEWTAWLGAGLHGRCRWRLPVLLLGILFAKGRRTAASWLRAVGVGIHFSDYSVVSSTLRSRRSGLAAVVFGLGRFSQVVCGGHDLRKPLPVFPEQPP